jgi:hypothetical protein
MSITLTINVDQYPLLKQIQDNSREGVVRSLFDKGYNIYIVKV